MKKIFSLLVLAALAAGSLSAFDWKAYGGIEKGDWLINAGVGFGTPLYGDMTIPPISASVDYALPIAGLPFTVGGYFGINGSKYEYEWTVLGETHGYTYTYTGLAFGARLGYHPKFFDLEKLDLYANLCLGYYLYTAEAEYHGYDGSGDDPVDYSTFFFATNVGARYFFTPRFGAFVELGYSAMSYVTAGLAVKI
jgi:hypothetical protein